MKRILVTGAGALLGQGIIRSLRFSNLDTYIITGDPDWRASGHCLGNKSLLLPMAKDPNYIQIIERIIYQEKVDLILIGTDVELKVFAKNQQYLENMFGVKIIVSPLNVIEIADNKWETAEFLRKNNFPYPFSAMTYDKKNIEKLRSEFNYPFIAKPVDGARSFGVTKINNNEELDKITSYSNNFVVQEYLSDEDGEFTSGCIVVKGECRSVVTLRRELKDGNTYRAYRDLDYPYDGEIVKIAEKLGTEGPINFQFRIRKGEPVVFEINGRFSGTTPLRFMFGFNEVEALVKYYLYDNEIIQPALRTGIVLRTTSDIFVENHVLEKLKNTGESENCSFTQYPFSPKT